MTLRSALIQIEQGGLVDWQLAGHECARPASVCQGSEEEDRLLEFYVGTYLFSRIFFNRQNIRNHHWVYIVGNPDHGGTINFRFDVGRKDGTLMLWKAGTVQLRNIKAKNVGSYFHASQILASPALQQVWL